MDYKTITHLLNESEIVDLIGNTEQIVQSICDDSRLAGENSLFFAIKGEKTDGHNYIDKAIEQGAKAIVCEELPAIFNKEVTYIKVEDIRHISGLVASRFWDEPSSDLKVIGVTGTNGKTTVATLIYQILSMAGYKTGLISTVETIIGSRPVNRTGSPTTPDAIRLQALLSDMKMAGCTHVVMEVSSHSTVQKRISGISFTGGIFTNITQDHLDYHGTFTNYRLAKQAFFDQLPASAFALSNLDDENGPFMMKNTQASVHYYGLNKESDFDLDIIKTDITGSLITINKQEHQILLPGAYNAYNVTASYGACYLLGLSEDRLAKVLPKLKSPTGRFDVIQNTKKKKAVIDYAHTPDAVIKILETIRGITTGNQRIITVLGAGGDRDKTKRPLMGNAAVELSDITIFTSDNPRSEEPLAIINDMCSQLHWLENKEYLINPDRKQAIIQASNLADQDDIIVILGKGHENYQEIKNDRIYFSDADTFAST